jgi:hypothetical protein
VNKFQSKVVQFARFFIKEESWTGLYFSIPAAAVVMLVLGLLLYRRVEGIIFVTAIFSPLFMIMLVSLICRLAYDWGCSEFIEVFHCFPRHNGRIERLVLYILKEKADMLRLMLSEPSTVKNPKAKAKKAKSEFWKAHRLAKTFGFPVFKRWKTHAEFNLKTC